MTHWLLTLSLLLGALPACGGPAEFALTGTARAAGTDGTATVEEIEGGSHMILVELEHLPPPERLGDGLTTYVVWLQEEGGQPQKAGVLAYDEDERSGRMRATTPNANVSVTITAEVDREVTSPSEIVVARQDLH
jgi:hypothetical protein